MQIQGPVSSMRCATLIAANYTGLDGGIARRRSGCSKCGCAHSSYDYSSPQTEIKCEWGRRIPVVIRQAVASHRARFAGGRAQHHVPVGGNPLRQESTNLTVTLDIL
jgi:hypothetical protein